MSERQRPGETTSEWLSRTRPVETAMAREHLEETERMAAEIARLTRRVRKLEGMIVDRYGSAARPGYDDTLVAIIKLENEAERIEARRARERKGRRK